MCTYYYLHHHHLPPCTRPTDMVVEYSFCPSARTDPSTGTRQPCANVHRDPTVQSVLDPDNLCAGGGCLASPDCSSGACRLAQLGGRWVCCQCGRGANEYRWCRHRPRRSPDTFCYHVCCANCKPDPRAPSSSSKKGR
jgi:hypothetical protein